VLTTAEAVGPVAAGMVFSTLVAYLTIYVLLLAAYVGALFHLARKGPGHAPPLQPALSPAE
jgi:cytochrome d ubiquinol oxidase subunit I